MKDIAFKYFSGEITPEAAKRLRDFLADGKENRLLFRQWEKEWKNNNIPTFHQVISYKKIFRRIISRKILRVSLVTTAAAAAIALVALFAGRGGRETFISPVVEAHVFTVETRRCEQTKVILPDSTVVWLNASSRLSYSDTYMVSERNVQLEGEGFFDVAHIDGCPFTVSFGNNAITVHGTRFNVSAYPSENVVEAALLEGGIEFSNKNVNVNLEPGEILALNLDSNKLVKYYGDVKSRTSWLGGSLDYSSISLERLLARISSIYGENITYVPSGITPSSFGIILNIKETIPNILDAINYISPIKWKYEGGVYYVCPVNPNTNL